MKLQYLYDILIGERICKKCIENMEGIRVYCANCGKEMLEESVFCGNCGCPVIQSKKKRKKINYVHGIIGFAILIFIISGVGFVFMSISKTKITKSVLIEFVTDYMTENEKVVWDNTYFKTVELVEKIDNSSNEKSYWIKTTLNDKEQFKELTTKLYIDGSKLWILYKGELIFSSVINEPISNGECWILCPSKQKADEIYKALYSSGNM